MALQETKNAGDRVYCSQDIHSAVPQKPQAKTLMQSDEHPGGGEMESSPKSHPSLPPSSFPFRDAPFTWVTNLWPQDVGGQEQDLIQQ